MSIAWLVLEKNSRSIEIATQISNHKSGWKKSFCYYILYTYKDGACHTVVESSILNGKTTIRKCYESM